MAESQLIEYKEAWRDEYLRWICGFANAQGGTLYIGRRDDGSICGVKDAKKLMEDIPNKVRDSLGLIVDVDLISENSLDFIKISVYRDRLYISNDCVFPENWTSETLFQKHRSLPHNPDIANTFFRAGFIESWGRGVEKICNLCKNYEIPDPVYIVHPCDIMIMFKAKAVENRSNAGRLQEDFRKTSERLQKNVPEFARKTLDFIKENPKITIAELASKLGLSERSVLSHIALLKSGGWIERVGGKTYGHWKIIRNN